MKAADVGKDVWKIVEALATEIPSKAADTKPQELSNSLWAACALKDEAPDMLNDVLKMVETIATEIPKKAADMKPQELSNSLFASMRLNEAVSTEAITALVRQAPAKIDDMKLQEVANTLEALVAVQERREIHPEPEIFTKSAARLRRPDLRGDDLKFNVPIIVWACARSKAADRKLLESVSRRYESLWQEGL